MLWIELCERDYSFLWAKQNIVVASDGDPSNPPFLEKRAITNCKPVKGCANYYFTHKGVLLGTQ